MFWCFFFIGSEDRYVLPANQGCSQRHSVHHQQGDIGAGKRRGESAEADQPQKWPAERCSVCRWRRQPGQPCTGTVRFFSSAKRLELKFLKYFVLYGLKFLYWNHFGYADCFHVFYLLFLFALENSTQLSIIALVGGLTLMPSV